MCSCYCFGLLGTQSLHTNTTHTYQLLESLPGGWGGTSLPLLHTDTLLSDPGQGDAAPPNSRSQLGARLAQPNLCLPLCS